MNESRSDRRQFSRELMGGLLTYSLLDTLFAHDAFADSARPAAAKWIARVNAMSRDLRGEKIEQVQWQEQVEMLFDDVDLKGFLDLIDFDKLTRGLKLKDRGERSLRPKLPQVEGLPTKLVFGHQLFALGRDRSVVPHGHNNMATSFLVLKGEFHGRHYNRLHDERRHMLIQPTIDRTFGPGAYSTISDHKDNIHWFKATSDTAFIFNIHVIGVGTDSGRRTGRIYVDPNGEKLSDGLIHAPIIRAAEAYRLYG